MGRGGSRTAPTLCRNRMMHYVIAHYHELALKGRNRPFLVDRLLRNLRETLPRISPRPVESLAGRTPISLDDPNQWSTIKTPPDAVSGPAHLSPAAPASSEPSGMNQAG